MSCHASLLLSSFASLYLGAVPTVPLADIRPGQAGVCHTVFAGDTVEPMPFEVRGRLENYLGPQRDLLLVRLTGDKAEFTGVVSGMSGSPCFVDGKLVGALGYSFASFAKEPIAGITPIADMLAVFDQSTAPLPWRLPAAAAEAAASSAAAGRHGAGQGGWPSRRHRQIFGEGSLIDAGLPGAMHLAAGDAAEGAAADDVAPASELSAGDAAIDSTMPSPSRTRTLARGTGHSRGLTTADVPALQPLTMMASVRGLRPQALRWLTPLLAEDGLVPQLAGGGGRAAQAPAKPLVPGGSVAAVLVRGDVDIAATGTVTWIEGDKVLAFGHPFLHLGPTSMPMANATVVNTMASAQHSFKQAVTGATVGEVVHDRLSAIGGMLGRRPRMVPVHGKVRHAGVDHSFHFDVVRDPSLTSRYLLAALAGALDNRLEASGHGTARLTTTLSFAGTAPVQLTQVVAGGSGEPLLARLAASTARAFDLLWDAPDGATPGDAAVDVKIELDDAVHYEQVETLRLDAATLVAGQKVEAAVALARQDAPSATVRFAFTVPQQWAGEDVTLLAAGAGAAERLLHQATGTPAPRNRAQVAQWLQAQRSPDGIYLLVLRQKPSFQHDGDSHAFLPPSAPLLFAHAPSHQLLGAGLALEQAIRRPGRVEGAAKLQLHVAPPR